MRRLFYLVPGLLALGFVMQLLALLEFFAMWNQGMDVNVDEVIVTVIVGSLELAAAIGLMLRKSWASKLVYVLASLFAVATTLMFLHSAFSGMLVTAAHWKRASSMLALVVAAAMLCIYLVRREYATLTPQGSSNDKTAHGPDGTGSS